MAAGQITVDLLLKTGTFETDIARAQKSVDRFSKGFKDSFSGNLAAGFARDFIQGIASIPGRLVDLVKGSIDAADHLNDLSQKTGITVETLGGIGFAAEQAGSSLDNVAGAVGKLNLSLAKAAAGNKGASDALRALGVQVLDPLTGKTISADQALVQIANTFGKAGDSPEKFRAAAGALGKQYQELIPLLNDGGKALLENIEFYNRYGGVTTETAKKADQFNDTLTKIKFLTGAFGRLLASELLTPLSGIAEAFLKSKEKGDGFGGAVSLIKSGLVGVATVASFVVNTLEALSAKLDGIIQKAQALGSAQDDAKKRNPLDVFGSTAVFDKSLGSAFSRIDEDTDKRIAAARKSFTDFQSLLASGGSLAGPNKKTGDIPGIPDAAKAAEAEAQLRKILDGVLKQIRSAADQQKDALAFSNKFLEGEYQDGIISLKNFYDDQKNIRAKGLADQLAEQDAIIKAEEAFKRSTSKPASRIDAQNKIDEARETKTRLTIKAAQEEQLALQQNQREVKALTDAYQSLNAQILSLQGDDFGAASIRNAEQVRKARELITQAGGDPARANELERQLQLQAQLGEVTKAYGFSLND